MWNRIAFLGVVWFTTSSCVAHTGLDAAEESGSAGATSRDETCAFLDHVKPSQAGPGTPRVFAPSSVEVKLVRADVKLAADGGMIVEFDIGLANSGGADAEAEVGYAFRNQGGAPERAFAESVRFADGIERRSCGVSSPPAMHAVYADEAVYAVVPIAAGAEAQVSGEAHFRARRSSWPMTLFGFEDAAAPNLKNFAWSYLRDPAYEAAAKSVRPYTSSFDLASGEEVRVVISAENRGNWIRAMSHEQNGAMLRSPGMFGWSFLDNDAPPRIWFEFNPELETRDEIALFQHLADTRKDDLRAMIHLADLLRFGGDKSERAASIEKILAVWDANAKAQLLTGGNDLRDAAIVALVESLDLAGRKPEAVAKAREGIAAIEATSERARAAVAWLTRYLEGK